MSQITFFDPFHYSGVLQETIDKEFPAIETVSWLSEPADTQYTDLALPAFLMSYGNPEPLKSLVRSDFDTDGAYAFIMKINITGDLVLPAEPTANDNIVDDSNVVLLSVAATHNLCAFINTIAGGLGSGPTTIQSIEYNWSEETEDTMEDFGRYIMSTIQWSHQCFVGFNPDTFIPRPETLYNRFTLRGELPQEEPHEVYPNEEYPGL